MDVTIPNGSLYGVPNGFLTRLVMTKMCKLSSLFAIKKVWSLKNLLVRPEDRNEKEGDSLQVWNFLGGTSTKIRLLCYFKRRDPHNFYSDELASSPPSSRQQKKAGILMKRMPDKASVATLSSPTMQ